MFEYLRNISLGKGLSISLIIFGNLIAPYWFIFQFASDVYKKNTLPQTLILALAIAIPISVYMLIIRFIEEVISNKSNEDEAFLKLLFDDENINVSNVFLTAFAKSSVYTAFLFYIPCILVFFKDTSEKNAIESLIGAGIGISIAKIMRIIYNNYQNKKTAKKEKLKE